MIVKAKKYGNSLVINIPSALCEFFHFKENRTEFSMENENGQFVIRARPDISKVLDKLDDKYSTTFENLAK